MYFSPKISNDGVVFHYDTGNTVRSYLGEPTTNLVTNGNFSNGKTGWGFTGTANSATSVGTYQGKVALFANGLRYYNETPGYFYQSISVTQGVTYTVSFKYYLLSGTLIFDPDGAYNGGGELTSTGQWVTYSATFVASSTSLTLNFYGASGVYAYYYITDIQVEQKSHATPYTTETRSATQGLKDLTRTRTIDLSNVSFDSSAQMTFDGTDDGAVVDDIANLSSYSAITVEGVVKGVGIGEYDRWFSGTSGTTVHYPDLAISPSGQLRYFFLSIDSAWRTVGVSVNTTKYSHLVYVFTAAGGVNIYVNGTSIYTATHAGGSFPSVSRLMIGNRYDRNGEALVGEVPVTKLYSRALSADEVQRNFNAVKSRFNIA